MRFAKHAYRPAFLRRWKHSTSNHNMPRGAWSTASNSTITPQDGSHAKRRMGLNREQMEAMNRVSLPGAVNGLDGPQRPTQLSLAPPSASTSAATSPSPTPSTPADSGPACDTPRLLLWMLSLFPFLIVSQKSITPKSINVNSGIIASSQCLPFSIIMFNRHWFEVKGWSDLSFLLNTILTECHVCASRCATNAD